MSIYNTTFTGIKWSVLGTAGNMLIQFLLSIVLARLLLPEQFGLVGIAYVVITISRSLVDSGLYQALIQKKDATENDYSIVFRFNFTISIILFALIWLSANKIEKYFNFFGLKDILLVLSFIVLIESFSLIQRAYLIKKINFKSFSKITVISRILSGIFSVFLAFNGAGVWSLVIKELLFSIFSTVGFWINQPVKINLLVPWKGIKPLIGFGMKVFIADQIENFANQLATILIGKNYNTDDIGFYSKAQELQSPFLNIAVGSINMVMFPTFASIQEDNIKLKDGYKAIIKTSSLIMFPVLFLGIIIADELIPLLLGENWTDMIPYFKLLCISSMIYPYTLYNLNIIKVKGRANLYLNVNLITKGMIIPAVIIGLQFHIIGLIIGLLIQRFLSALINSFFSGRLINYGIFEQIKDIAVKLFFASITFICIYGFKLVLTHRYIHINSVVMIIVLTSAFFIVYSSILMISKDADFKNVIRISMKSLK